ncbi:major histocompatibility complex class I-related gene protein-like [Oryzias latipes]|uniref:major histocompatibility complex class I-related gene protein-like n=1 Tax=Oryzias latipes TaxID=8090 RepID=UPI0009DB2519|nr:major histocompatibility complex class I-related gene protein-like [Oryzias latipes]
MHYGRSFLQRTERPSVSFLQKTPSSPVCCHATGFYPDRADLFWRKDGEEIHEGVEKGQILPNHDGTFQMSSELNVSLIKHEDWRRYDCVFQLSGLTEDIVSMLDKTQIQTNWVSPSEFPVGPVVGGAAGVVLLLVISGVLYCCWRNRNDFQPVDGNC